MRTFVIVYIVWQAIQIWSIEGAYNQPHSFPWFNRRNIKLFLFLCLEFTFSFHLDLWAPWTKHIEIKTRQMIQLIFLKSEIKNI